MASEFHDEFQEKHHLAAHYCRRGVFSAIYLSTILWTFYVQIAY